MHAKEKQADDELGLWSNRLQYFIFSLFRLLIKTT